MLPKVLAIILITALVCPAMAAGTGTLKVSALTRGSQWHAGYDVPDIYIINTPNESAPHYNGSVVSAYILPDGTVPPVFLPAGNYTAFLPFGQGKTLESIMFDIVEGQVTYATFKGYSGISTADAGC